MSGIKYIQILIILLCKTFVGQALQGSSPTIFGGFCGRGPRLLSRDATLAGIALQEVVTPPAAEENSQDSAVLRTNESTLTAWWFVLPVEKYGCQKLSMFTSSQEDQEGCETNNV